MKSIQNKNILQISNKNNHLSILQPLKIHQPIEPISQKHKLNIKQVINIQTEPQELKQIINNYPQLNQQIPSKKIKKLSNGLYIGNLQADSNQISNGFAKIKYNDGSIFYANFINQKANGFAILYYKKGQYYLGNFINNHFEGKGKYLTPELSYQGQFKNNLFQGQGQLKFNQNSKYFKGTFINGQMKKGIYQWKTNLKKYSYTGSFKNNKFQDSNATLACNNGTYIGQFKNGKKQGKGRFQYTEKYQYIGQYSNNKKNGFGTLYNPLLKVQNGNVTAQFCQLQENISYQGQFKDDLPHGQGAIYDKDSKSLKKAQYDRGIWINLIKPENY